MKYCKSCLQPDTRPSISFNKNGICPACIYFKEIQQVDFEERFEILKNLLKKHPRKKASIHDCVLGVSGGKDSTRQALWVREKLGLNPLLVCLSYPPEQVTEIGTDNLSNLVELGFDLHIKALSPVQWKKLLKVAFIRFCNWGRPTELALFTSVPRIAIQYKIPLILWGENPAMQLGDLSTLGSTGYDGNSSINANTLQGGDIQWMLEEGFSEKDLISYTYPTLKEFEDANLQIIYLGWFLKDWSLRNNGSYSILNGLKIRSDTPENTGDLYSVSRLDEDWVTLNQMIKYYKFGFGMATEYMNEEIRMGRITKGEAIELVNKFDGCCSNKYIEDFCQYIDITVDRFWEIIKLNLNKKLFDINSKGKIIKKFQPGTSI